MGDRGDQLALVDVECAQPLDRNRARARMRALRIARPRSCPRSGVRTSPPRSNRAGRHRGSAPCCRARPLGAGAQRAKSAEGDAPMPPRKSRTRSRSASSRPAEGRSALTTSAFLAGPAAMARLARPTHQRQRHGQPRAVANGIRACRRRPSRRTSPRPTSGRSPGNSPAGQRVRILSRESMALGAGINVRAAWRGDLLGKTLTLEGKMIAGWPAPRTAPHRRCSGPGVAVGQEVDAMTPCSWSAS